MNALALEFPPELIDAIAARVAAQLRPAGPEPWVGVKAVAEHMDCKPPRVYELTGRKDETRLPHRREGSRLLFRLSEVDAYLEGRKP